MLKRILPRLLRNTVLLLIGTLALWAAGYVAREHTIRDIRELAALSAELNATLIRNNLERYRPLPFVLSQDVDVRKALSHREQSHLAYLNQKLEHMADGVSATAIYVLDKNGNGIAANNWRDPHAIVGVNYRFRPYYVDAIADGRGEYFALGIVSQLPGLYVSHRVDRLAPGPLGGIVGDFDTANRQRSSPRSAAELAALPSEATLGVVVIKVEFQQLENDWRHLREPIFVTDSDGVVLLSSRPEWRFRTFPPSLHDADLASDAMLRFGQDSFFPITLEGDKYATIRLPEGPEPDERYLHVQKPIQTVTGWHLHVLAPVGHASTRASYSAQVSTLPAVLLIAGAWTVWRQRQRRRLRSEYERAQMLNHLETQVDERTRELALNNVQLAHEIEERERTEQHVNSLQDELAQAGKLSVLGQITAGVAHEINQPVAAIRSYAENAALLLTRDRPEEAESNMRAITHLTERIGHITAELRQFARRRVDNNHDRRADIAGAVESALLLLGARQRRANINVHINVEGPLTAAIEPLRLEQVLINILQNAMDALLDVGKPSIWINARVQASAPAFLEIVVRDNGPGMDAARRTALFTPFATGKPDGLGLGLVIARELAREAQGDLDAPPAETYGAVFVLTLPIA